MVKSEALNLKHDEGNMANVFMISKERSKELVVRFISAIMACDKVSQSLECIWADENLNKNEKVFLTMRLGKEMKTAVSA